MQVHELALQRNKYKHLNDEQWRWFLQQVDGKERMREKLPTLVHMTDWWFPVRISCEQCSSESTAKYKLSVISPQYSENSRMVDLTGGYGIDTYFLSDTFEHTDYVERDAELCRIAEHNLKEPSACNHQHAAIAIHNCSAEEFLVHTTQLYDLIFLDPARRDSHGGKVFRLTDCSPNVTELLPTLLTHLQPTGQLLLKLSPMIDITQALRELSTVTPADIQWDVHVVAVKNEVKEVLLSGQFSAVCDPHSVITAIDLAEEETQFVFTREEEWSAVSRESSVFSRESSAVSGQLYLYEPNAAILKAGAYKLVGQRFGLYKLDTNTHLYTADTYVPHFPGRVWVIEQEPNPIPSFKGKELKQANVLTRNYPLTAEQLRKKLKLKDGGEYFVIGCRVQGKPTLFYAKRTHN